MIGKRTFLACLPGLLAVPLLAQPQIGGGNCSTATLTGNYSATLTGRNLTSGLAFSAVSEGVGSVNFDGQAKVTFTLTTNTIKTFGTAQTLSGTYTLQANCVGSITIATGDTASFTLEAYNEGKNYLIIGQDGVYAFTGSGGVLPATCPTTLTAGGYSINGTGFGLTSGSISTVFNALGLLQLSGTNTIAMNVFLAANGGTKNISATGTYSLGTNCSATATLTDSAGNSYSLALEFTASNGNNFALVSSSSTGIFTGSGRVL
ncbi:MAG TPA: hypothetical protein VK752_06885 [Bryobacteraceae bacterium]|jgi:hypothetical protein|nr:hypothetical protein [Bryobacteraceae bacterium]